MSDIIEVISDDAPSTVIEVIERGLQGPPGEDGAGGVIVRETDGTPSASVTTLEFPNGSITIDGGKAIINAGSSLTVRELDGSPTGTATTLIVPNGSLSFSDGDATLSFVLTTDGRLTDSREWIAETVSQAEAELGIGTDRRAWTAQRVRQAIVGWWTQEEFETRLGVMYDTPESRVALECADSEWNFFNTTTRDNLRTALQAAAASHTHGNITNAGAIGTTANVPLITGASGVLQAGSFGTTANTFCQGNDDRVVNAQQPTFETVSQSLAALPQTINRSGGQITSIVYTLPNTSTITKTINRTGGVVSSIVLSGATPAGIQLTKTFTRTSGRITGVSYS